MSTVYFAIVKLLCDPWRVCDVGTQRTYTFTYIASNNQECSGCLPIHIFQIFKINENTWLAVAMLSVSVCSVCWAHTLHINGTKHNILSSELYRFFARSFFLQPAHFFWNGKRKRIFVVRDTTHTRTHSPPQKPTHIISRDTHMIAVCIEMCKMSFPLKRTGGSETEWCVDQR